MKLIKRLMPLLSILIAGCFTDGSDKEYKLVPDLSIGGHWKYQLRQFSKADDGAYGDTLIYFIQYAITGDTVIGDSAYRILEEKDLVVVDSSLEILRSLSAVKSERGRVVIKSLPGGDQGLGRYPMKAGAAGIFDTANFRDEVIALSFPIRKGSEWQYRRPGHPFGHGPAKKVFLGVEPIEVAGTVWDALKFEFIIGDMDWIRSFEWYSQDLKLKSVSYSRENDYNDDSAFFEEEYLDGREFTREDSQTVLESFRKW